MKIRLTPFQSRMIRPLLSPRGRVLAVCGRRSGKTMAAIAATLVHLHRRNSTVIYMAPTFRQGKNIVWETLHNYIDPALITHSNSTELELKLANSSILYIRSGESYDNVRGLKSNLLILDEAALMSRTVYDVLFPTVLTTSGSIFLLTTPRGVDNWIYDFWNDHLFDPAWKLFNISTFDAGILSENDLLELKNEYEKGNIDRFTWNNEYLARFDAFDIRVYSDFDMERNTIEAQPLDTRMPVYIGMDFNVEPMTIVVGQRKPDHIYIDACYEFPNSHTEAVAEWIKSRFANHVVYICPDATGIRRTTNSTLSDMAILTKLFGFRLITEKTANGKPVNPSISDRIAHVNRLFRLPSPHTLKINKRDRRLLEVLGRMTFDEKTKLPKKDGKYDHISDALGYLCMAIHVPLWRSPSTFTSKINLLTG